MTRKRRLLRVVHSASLAIRCAAVILGPYNLGDHSVVVLCIVFFRKFNLLIGIRNSCSISLPAGRTCQKCFTKHHSLVDAPECMFWGPLGEYFINLVEL